MQEEKKDLVQEEVVGSVTEDATPKENKKKKQLKIVGVDNYGMYYIGFEDGGELPKGLKGARWSDRESAQFVVDDYNKAI